MTNLHVNFNDHVKLSTKIQAHQYSLINKYNSGTTETLGNIRQKLLIDDYCVSYTLKRKIFLNNNIRKCK